MSARTRAAGLVLLTALAAPAGMTASAQPTKAAPVTTSQLGQIDSWGVGWLGKADGPMPANIWANTTADALKPLFSALQPSQLSPAGRAAVRRVMLSSAKTPPDGAVLAPERLRLIEQVGETEHSIDLRKKFPDTDWGKLGDRIASDYELSQGRQQTACARAADRRGDDPVWMPVRALCYAVAGDFKGASLVSEQISSGDDKWDAWLLAALSTIQAPGQTSSKTRPDGRYDTAYEAAVSIAAKLPVPANGMAATPADIAASIVMHPSATIEQKRAALIPALEGGKIKAADVLAVLALKDETPATAPAAKPGVKRAAPQPDFLDLALAANAVADATPDAKATAFTVALKSADTAGEFKLAAVALLDAVKALPKSDATLPNAETFARAALAAGDMKEAGAWRKLLDTTPADKADAWASARIDLLIAFASDAPKAGAILDKMIDAVPPLPEGGAPVASKAATPQQRQQDLRRIENTRVMFLFAGMGRDLSPDQRALLATQKAAGRGVSDAALTRIASAADQDANGEAGLAAIGLLGSDVSALSFAGLADILKELRRAGFDRDASAIALEALQPWKAL